MYGRTVKKLTLDAAGPIEGAMQSQDIYVDQNVGVAFENNRFTAVGDIYGFSFELPEDCVVVKNVAFSVNYADCTIRWGLYESAKKFVGYPIVP